MKRVLMIAFHYPPQHGSSGLQRTLSFGNYLPEFGWNPIILTAHPRAYRTTNYAQMQDISPMLQIYRPDVLWTTYPIATAHLIGISLHKLTGIPWIADFRDSMTKDHYPKDPLQKLSCEWIECRSVRYRTVAVFTAPGTVKMYSERYSDLSNDKWTLISNGYGAPPGGQWC